MHLVLYSRRGCSLCEELQAELSLIPAVGGYPIEIIDVDGDPATRARYGHKVPVLLFGGAVVCHGRLDREELAKALAEHR